MNYKIPFHMRNYVKAELQNYKTNKKRLETLKRSREVLIVAERLERIDRAYNRLNKEDREVAKLIFNDRYTQPMAEIEKGISYKTFYNVMNKIIYFTAEEMELI